MKMITQMNKNEIEAIDKLVAGMTDSERTLICKFGGDMYLNGTLKGMALGAGGVLTGMLLYTAVSSTKDIIRKRRRTKELMKKLENE